MNYEETPSGKRVRRIKAPMKPIPGAYSVVAGYTSSRILFWNLLSPKGERIAEIRAKRSAIRIAEALNRNGDAKR